MLISLVMTRGEAKTYTIEFKPPEEQSDPLLDGIFPDSEWLAELPFNTDLLKFFISDRPLDDAQGVIKLPPIPFAKSTKNKTALRNAERPRTQAAQLKGISNNSDLPLQRRDRRFDNR